MELTPKAKRMLQILLQTDGTMTMQALADQMKVSKRTAQREMDDISSFLKGTGVNLITKMGKGIWLDGETDKKQALLSELTKSEVYDAGNREERRKRLILEILKEKDLKKLYEKLLMQKQYLIEEEIIQSKEVNEINPNVVCSLRICTLYKDGKVYLVGNAFRINQDESEIIGCTNDLYFSLGKDGKIDSNVIDDYGKIYEEHPLTHKKFKEVKIPDVKEAFLMCQEAALKLPQVRYIGWDIAFTDNGPVMVEGNEYPGYGILQLYKLKNSKEGYLKVHGDI